MDTTTYIKKLKDFLQSENIRHKKEKFTCLVGVTLRYFMLFVAIGKGDVFLISFSAHV